MTTLTILGHALLSATAPCPLDGPATLPSPVPGGVEGSSAPAAEVSALESALGRSARQDTVVVQDASARQIGTERRMYLRVDGGFVTTEDSDGPDEDVEFDEGYLVALAFGWRTTPGPGRVDFDVELEGVWNDQDADDQGPIQAVEDVTVAGVFLNGTFDFHLADRWSIYAGAGIGSAWVDVGTESDAVNDFEEDDGPFLAWQAKAGLRFLLTDTMALQGGYRFINIDDVEIDDDLGNADFDLETMQHIAEIGLRFSF